MIIDTIGTDALPRRRFLKTSNTSAGVIVIESKELSLISFLSSGRLLAESSIVDCLVKYECKTLAFSCSSTTIVSLVLSINGGIEEEDDGAVKDFKTFHQSLDVMLIERNFSAIWSRWSCFLCRMRAINSFLKALNLDRWCGLYVWPFDMLFSVA